METLYHAALPLYSVKADFDLNFTRKTLATRSPVRAPGDVRQTAATERIRTVKCQGPGTSHG